MVNCKCGCGREIKRKAYWPYTFNKYIQGHNILGNKLSTSTKKKISDARKGLFKIGVLKIWITGKKRSEKTKDKISKTRKNKFKNGELKYKSNWGYQKGHEGYNKGIPRSKEVKEKIGNANRGRQLFGIRGKKHWNWRGGHKLKNRRIRASQEYKRWRRAVFERDDYTCLNCGYDSCVNLEAHHCNSVGVFPELALDIDNGETLCMDCHCILDEQRGVFKS